MSYLRNILLCFCAFDSQVATAQQPPSPERDNAIVESLRRIPDAKMEAYPLNTQAANDLLLRAMQDSQRSRIVRTAAAIALGKKPRGQRLLLKLTYDKKITEDLEFAVADSLLGSDVPEIRDEASRLVHDELLRRSMIAAKPIAKVAPQAIEAIDLLYSGKVDWNAETGTVTFSSSGNMPDSKEGFFWNVPPTVKQIVINSDVTVQGAFRVKFRDAKNPLFIKGRDRKTSVIVGTPQQKWTENAGIAESDKWRYGAINVVEDAIVHVSNLTSRNPRGYNISGYANKAMFHVNGCDLLDTRGGDNNNSDGFLGAAGSSIRNSFISTSDDAIKIYHDITIESVTIEQHRNGAPLQFGWGGENDTATATIKDLTIRGVAADGNYNMAPLTWVAGQGGVRNVAIDGLTIDLQGKIYNGTSGTWQPIGLMSVKPVQCTLNLKVNGARIGELPLGVNAAKGSLRIE